MKYAIQFGLLATGALIAATFGVAGLVLKILLLWTAIAFTIVAIAYAVGRPQLLLKRDDGSQPVVAWLLLWPYFLLTWFAFLIYRVSHHGKTPVAEVLPGIWFARRLTEREMRESPVSWSAVLDLAAEFPRVAPAGVTYRAISLLDGAVPTEAQVRDAVAWIGEQLERGDVLVHCALGHGRTGLVVVAWLLMSGHVSDAKSGVALLKSRRDTFGMSKSQLAFVERFTASLPGQVTVNSSCHSH